MGAEFEAGTHAAGTRAFDAPAGEQTEPHDFRLQGLVARLVEPGDVAEAFLRWRGDEPTLRGIYQQIPSHDFSRHLIEPSVDRLWVVPVPPCGWSDLGTPERVARNSQLVWTWDTLSLALLLDWAPETLQAVPTADGGAVDVALQTVSARDGRDLVSLDPWPFAAAEVRVHCEGRRLTAGFPDDAALARGLAQAPWETVEFTMLAGAELREGS